MGVFGKLILVGGMAAGALWIAEGAETVSRENGRPLKLKEVLRRMDEMSGRLKTLSASLQYTRVTVLVGDKSTEYGEIFFRNRKGPQILIQFKDPNGKTVLFGKNKAEIYLPKMNQLQEYDLGDHHGMLEQFLLLGFGTQSDKLQKSYNLKLLGEKELDGDAVVVLELTPKKAEVLDRIQKVTLWVSEESWLPIQQKFHEPSGDYTLAKYGSVKVNRYLPGSKFRIQTQGDVTRLRMTN